MIKQDAFTIEPWALRETTLDLDLLAQTESVFALSNGHVGWRGNLDEGEPHGLPGSYLNGVYEIRPLPFSEKAYGRPESSQTVINVTNGKLIRLFVDDEAFDVRYGSLTSHERLLDFRAGTLTRKTEWVSPTGASVRVTSTRLVSFSHRSVAAVSYEVEPVDSQRRITVQSELLSNEQLPSADGDPRASAILEHPLLPEYHGGEGNAVVLVHRTQHSGLRVGAAMDHLIEAPGSVRTESRVYDDGGMVTASVVLKPGQRLRLIKFVSYGWSSVRSLEAIRDQIWAALSGVRQSGWDTLLSDQRAYLDDFWAKADVETEGDVEIQQAVRFGLFHVLQAGARGEERPIPAKGLTGPGYDGHAFWDTEAFVLPVLTLTAPEAAASALRWRQSTLEPAIQRAKLLGLAGAAFPWRTIAGQECSGYWPAGTAAFHVNADIAEAVVRYLDATGDLEFGHGPGLELLVHTARLWRSLGHHDSEGHFHIDGVTGPDEYSAIADDNVYTNLMAQRNLQAAATLAEKHPDRARELSVDAEESAAWRDAAEAMFVPFDEALGVHPQAAGFTGHQVWDFAGTPPEHYPLLLHYPYFDLYRKQVVKQADLVLAMQMRPDAFTAEQKASNFAYYEALTVRDSSLSACTQAVMAAEVGQLDLAFDYLGEAALMDLDDLEHNTRDGVHIASLAGTWVVLIAGFGGLRHRDGTVTFAPRLPDGLARLAFSIVIKGRRLRVEITHGSARYLLADGDPLEIAHHGEQLTLTAGQTEERPITPMTSGPRPSQPAGRAPMHRRVHHDKSKG
ncbi:MAG TPA: glycosyl hydrolase family 65 protein [Streptosporangiaceae bacterium]|jgi:alpha,alpha-trehalose phosphorylase|nr:glycosyl hydrolase family 65 protein [Streptosporangiaceae bacterium]